MNIKDEIFMGDLQGIQFLCADGNRTYYNTDIPGPYGDTVKLTHNKTYDVFIREYPASGSFRTIIQEPEALELIARATAKVEYTGSYIPTHIDFATMTIVTSSCYEYYKNLPKSQH